MSIALPERVNALWITRLALKLLPTCHRFSMAGHRRDEVDVMAAIPEAIDAIAVHFCDDFYREFSIA